MFYRNLCASAVAASVIFLPVQRAQAGDAAAALGGALLGGIIVNEMHKNKQRKQTYSRSSGISSAQREENRQVQRSLNFFGYNVGSADGALGRRSRAGISQYQADMGFPIDGYLDDHERVFLLNSHQRALASAHVAPYAQVVATQGQAGLLRVYRNEQLGIATPQVPPTTMTQQPGTTHMAMAPVPVQPMPQTIPQAVPQALPQTVPQTVSVPAPTTQEPVAARADTGGALPSFSFAVPKVTAADLCNQVSIRTATNGGLTTPATLTDATFALSEQFCQQRTAAIADTARIEASIPNMTPAQVEAQCQGLTQAIAPQIAAITTAGADQVIAQTSAFLQSSGQPIAQLVSGGKVCLGVGYRTGDGEMALASAVLVTSAGQHGYGEAVSHHLREGIGVDQPAAGPAGGWMNLALGAAGSGAPVLGQTPERIAVLTAASATPSSQASLPVFPTVPAKN
ncbi:peptidoglycan-binding protein [Seohaeicola saemankumensis]|nr:peptidoglycan-binding domain-containing protein [Seohaeicola saemankumensis]MCA0870103.1 peptidoglycan-binding protein [Seohaeicola saemankumensis]